MGAIWTIQFDPKRHLSRLQVPGRSRRLLSRGRRPQLSVTGGSAVPRPAVVEMNALPDHSHVFSPCHANLVSLLEKEGCAPPSGEVMYGSVAGRARRGVRHARWLGGTIVVPGYHRVLAHKFRRSRIPWMRLGVTWSSVTPTGPPSQRCISHCVPVGLDRRRRVGPRVSLRATGRRPTTACRQSGLTSWRLRGRTASRWHATRSSVSFSSLFAVPNVLRNEYPPPRARADLAVASVANRTVTRVCACSQVAQHESRKCAPASDAMMGGDSLLLESCWIPQSHVPVANRMNRSLATPVAVSKASY